MSGDQSKDPPMECAVVNAVTKVKIPGRMDPVMFEVHYATLIRDENKFKSFLVPFEIMKHGVKINMIPPKYGGTRSILVDDKTLPFLFDDEKLYWKISMPTGDDLDTLKWFELIHQLCWAKPASVFPSTTTNHIRSHGTNGVDI
jgi:hypothetical protein